MKITVVIPAYNEEHRIGSLLKDLKNGGYRYLVVDDGSKDGTFHEAKQYGGMVLRHRVNLGKGAAMKTGAEAAFEMGADAVIFMDSDGQHLVSDLNNFIEALKKGNQLVYGSRNLNYGVPLIRYLGNKAASLLISLLFGSYISDILCGFRAMTNKVYRQIKWETSGYAVETEMIVRAAKAKLKHCEVPVTTVYYDHVKGVTALDAINIFLNVIRWRVTL